MFVSPLRLSTVKGKSTVEPFGGEGDGRGGAPFSAVLWFLVSPRNQPKSPYRFTTRCTKAPGERWGEKEARRGATSHPWRGIAEQRGRWRPQFSEYSPILVLSLSKDVLRARVPARGNHGPLYEIDVDVKDPLFRTAVCFCARARVCVGIRSVLVLSSSEARTNLVILSVQISSATFFSCISQEMLYEYICNTDQKRRGKLSGMSPKKRMNVFPWRPSVPPHRIRL